MSYPNQNHQLPVVKHLKVRRPTWCGPDSANNDEIIIKLIKEQPMKAYSLKPEAISRANLKWYQ
jgi:hypothetical protein